MIKSMTAFAALSSAGELGELKWEVRTLNHRFLEVHLRLPEELRGLELQIRSRLAARLQRGKVDCVLRYTPAPSAQNSLRINRLLVEQVLAAGQELGALIGRPYEPVVADLLRWPGVIQEPDLDLDRLASESLVLFDRTLDVLVETREREGERLGGLLRERIERLEASVARVRARLPEVLDGVRQRLSERLAELRAELDPGRLEQEIALLALRLDIDEELDRLEAHLAEVREALGRDEPLGRRLDFLMQELNREANTLASKSVDVAVTREAVEMKVLIEQMREQIQNIE